MEDTARNNAAQNLEASGRSRAPSAELAGVVDASVVADLHREFLEIGLVGADVRIGMAQAERLDSSALQLLLALGREVARRGGSFSLDGCPSEIRNYLELAGASGYLPDSES